MKPQRLTLAQMYVKVLRELGIERTPDELAPQIKAGGWDWVEKVGLAIDAAWLIPAEEAFAGVV
jgi:hypothetical protein